jgi:hypothetical protein
MNHEARRNSFSRPTPSFLLSHEGEPLRAARKWTLLRAGLSQNGKDERADVTTDGQVSLSNGTLQRKRTGLRTRSHRNVCHTPKPVRAASSAGCRGAGGYALVLMSQIYSPSAPLHPAERLISG